MNKSMNKGNNKNKEEDARHRKFISNWRKKDNNKNVKWPVGNTWTNSEMKEMINLETRSNPLHWNRQSNSERLLTLKQEPHLMARERTFKSLLNNNTKSRQMKHLESTERNLKTLNFIEKELKKRNLEEIEIELKNRRLKEMAKSNLEKKSVVSMANNVRTRRPLEKFAQYKYKPKSKSKKSMSP